MLTIKTNTSIQYTAIRVRTRVTCIAANKAQP
jgi:hypothetical protein